MTDTRTKKAESSPATSRMHCAATGTYCLELIQQLLRQVDDIKGNQNCRYRLRQQLTVMTDVLNGNASHRYATALRQEILVQVEGVLQECLQIVEMMSARSNVSQMLLPRKNRLRNVEFNLMQTSSSLITAFTLSMDQNITSESLKMANTIECNMKIAQNPEANFHAGFPKVLKAPHEVSNVAVSYNKGNVNISWSSDVTDIIDSFQIMRDDDPSDIFPDISGYCNDVNFSFDPIRNFKPFHKYTIKIRAINTAGRSDWNKEGIIVLITEAPPVRPSIAPKLITFFNSTTNSTLIDVDSVHLAVPLPSQEECNGLPLDKITIQYSTHHSTEHSYHHEYVKLCPENDQVNLEINDIDIANNDYTFAAFWSNSAGDGPSSNYIEVNKRNIVPSSPHLVRESSNKTDTSIKIRWAQPQMNTFAVDKYEIQKLNSHYLFETCAESSKCSATIEGLKQRTKYVFRVCAVTTFGCRSEYSLPITIKTKLSKAVKQSLGGVAAVGGFGIGTIIGPVAGPILGVGAAIGIGVRVSKKVKSKPGKVAAATSVAIASALPMAMFGTVVAPLVIPVCAGGVARDMIVNGFNPCTSDQSCDEEEQE